MYVRKKYSHIRIRTMVNAFGPFGTRSSSFVSTEIRESSVLLCARVCVCLPDGDDGRFELCNSFMFSVCFFRVFSPLFFPPPRARSLLTSEFIMSSGKVRRPRPRYMRTISLRSPFTIRPSEYVILLCVVRPCIVGFCRVRRTRVVDRRPIL